MRIHVVIRIDIMGRHKEWRRIAKRERRRRIRKRDAQMRDNILSPSHSEYATWLREQESLELVECEQIEALNRIENEKWLQAERIALINWQELQQRREKIRQKRLEQETKLRMERELELKLKEEEEKRLKEIEEENKRKQQAFMEKLELFLSGDSEEPPAELLVSSETKPNHEACPFFTKTGCCRFGNQCSRNHQFPGISKVLLAVNFFTHFGLDNAMDQEYDADVMLEYEYSETYKDFKEFFYDVLPEFEKYGQITQFKVSGVIRLYSTSDRIQITYLKCSQSEQSTEHNNIPCNKMPCCKRLKVCNNYEKHLRGNTYIEFSKLRCAVAAYRALHSRWFAGKRLSLQFCRITSWKNAICGLQSTRRCPKGRACNFLHVFRNPNNLYPLTNIQESERRQITPRSWRWSESPEVEVRRRRSRSRERVRRSRSQERLRQARSRSRERLRQSRQRARVSQRGERRQARRRRSRSRERRRSDDSDRTNAKR